MISISRIHIERLFSSTFDSVRNDRQTYLSQNVILYQLNIGIMGTYIIIDNVLNILDTHSEKSFYSVTNSIMSSEVVYHSNIDFMGVKS